MEQYEIDLIQANVGQDSELKNLWDEHIVFKKKLEKFESKSYLTPEETQQMRELKKMKLAGKTKLQLILDKYKRTED